MISTTRSKPIISNRSINRFVICLMIVSLATGSFSCSPSTDTLPYERGHIITPYNPDYSIAIVKTTDIKRTSYIEFYDTDLALVNVIRYPYAQLINEIQQNTVSGGRLWLIPQGLQGFQNDKKAISLDIGTGAINEFRIDQVSINCIVAGDYYAYASSNLNFSGYISRVDIESGGVQYLQREGYFPRDMILANDVLYVLWLPFGQDVDDDAYIISYDANLNVINEINLSSKGVMAPMRFTQVSSNGLFFFESHRPAQTRSSEEPVEVFSYSIDDDSVSPFLTSDRNSISGTIVHKDMLFVFSSLSRTDSYGDIDIYSTKTGELLASKSVNYRPTNGVVVDDCLYVISGRWDGVLAKYAISDGMLVELGRVDLYMNGSPASPNQYYPSVIFSNTINR
ncbi:MAG: hypothetical protein FWH40_04505 [Coriobacteriia bacterium]|nr:hypothetical protein [Coriobacteriia bacterium]